MLLKEYQLGTTNAQKIGLALKICNCDVISPISYLVSLKVVAELWCHPLQPALFCFFFSAQPYPINIVSCLEKSEWHLIEPKNLSLF